MTTDSQLRVVIDTNVVFEGLTQQGSVAGLTIDAWLSGLLDVYVSNALAYEYQDVLSRKVSETRLLKLRPILGTLLSYVEFTTIYYSWRPSSPDAGDDHIIDCAMNAGAIVVTSNIRDFQNARESLGLQIISPTELITRIVS